MSVRIITLSEDAAVKPGLVGEQGLSMLVQTGQSGILFDTGQSTSAVHNARRLGIDLRDIGLVALSHSHSDHTGGLREVLREVGKEIRVVAHPDIFSDRFVRFPSAEAARKCFPAASRSDLNAGMPYTRRELEGWGAEFRLVSEPEHLAEGIVTSGEVPIQTGFETPSSTDVERWVWNGASYVVDEVRDDLAMALTTTEGLVVLLGCAHRGIINTLRQVQQVTGVRRIHMVLGGSHLIGASEDRICRTMQEFEALDILWLGLCHCTSFAVEARLAVRFGNRFFHNHAGTCIELPDLVP